MNVFPPLDHHADHLSASRMGQLPKLIHRFFRIISHHLLDAHQNDLFLNFFKLCQILSPVSFPF